jgi:hypothetical protein
VPSGNYILFSQKQGPLLFLSAPAIMGMTQLFLESNSRNSVGMLSFFFRALRFDEFTRIPGSNPNSGKKHWFGLANLPSFYNPKDHA